MSVHVESWAWKQKVGSATRKLVLVKLAQNADDDGWSWWRQAKMASECEVSRSTVNGHIQALRGLGLVQVFEQRRDDGGRSSSRYRVIGPWVDDTPVENQDRGVGTADSPPVGQHDSTNRKKNEVVPLGGGRFHVPSNSTPGVVYMVDIERLVCTCQARRGCRHIASALAESDRLNTLGRKAMRDGLWDVLVEIFGEPTQKTRADRGGVVSELAELLTAAKVPMNVEAWQAEVRQRYRALAADWGVGKVTLHSFVKPETWTIAGKLATGDDNVRSDRQHGDVQADGISRYTRD